MQGLASIISFSLLFAIKSYKHGIRRPRRTWISSRSKSKPPVRVQSVKLKALWYSGQKSKAMVGFSAFQACQAPIHCRADRFQARHLPHWVPFQRTSQKALVHLAKQQEKRHYQPHLWCSGPRTNHPDGTPPWHCVCNSDFTNLHTSLDIDMQTHFCLHRYVSGWQCSSTASTSNEPGPDLADYPMDTVPNKVEHLFFAQLFHDRKQREARLSMTPEERARTPKIDYLRPMIADADTGHGGITAVMKLAKMFVERGAAGIHSKL